VKIAIALAAVVATAALSGSASAQDILLTSDVFAVQVSRSSGEIASLKLPGDVYDTNYVMEGKILGDAAARYRIAGGSWQVGNTSSSSDTRSVTSGAPTWASVSYQNDSSDPNGIKAFRLDETYSLQGSSLIWTLRFKNRISQSVELGDVGLPLLFSTNYDTDTATIFTKRVIRHSFISGDGSFIVCERPNGFGPYLVMTPLTGTHLEYFTDRNGVYTAYVHAVVQANVTDAGGTWRQPITSRVLAPAGSPGDEVTYAFKFTWAADHDQVRQVMVQEVLIDVQAVPGMVAPQDMPAMFVLTTKQPINSLTAELPAAKNVHFPVQSEIDAIEYHLQHFVWGGLQRMDTELPYPYGIYGIDNWYVNRNSSYGFGSGGLGKEHLWRAFDYPAMIGLYCNMYRIAKLYPGATKYLDANGYLDRAFNTAKAYFLVPYGIKGWWGAYVDTAYKVGCFNELYVLNLIDDLYKEGRTADADWLTAEWEKKVKYFVYDDPCLFGSEYSFDSTAYESTQAMAKYGVEHDVAPDQNLWQDKNTGVWYSHPHVTKQDFWAFMEKQMAANIADRGWLEPSYCLLGTDIRGFGTSAYLLSYMTQMGGWAVLDYALYYSSRPEEYVRLGYASYLASWALVNAGDAASNYGFWYPGAQNDGAAGWGFEPQKVASPWDGIPQGRGIWSYDGEIDHGFMGGIRSAATVVVNDPIFGLFAYGGSVSEGQGSITVVPMDGLGQRFHMLNLTPAFHMDLNRDGFVSIQAATTPDGTLWQVDLTLENRVLNAHDTELSVLGLPTGDYAVSVNGSTQTVRIESGVRAGLHLPVPSNASCSVRIRLITLLRGTVKDALGNPIANAAVQIGGFGGPAAITGPERQVRAAHTRLGQPGGLCRCAGLQGRVPAR